MTQEGRDPETGRLLPGHQIGRDNLIGVQAPTGPAHPHSKFTPELRQKFLEAIRAGASISTAAGYAGVSERGIFRWIEHSNNGVAGYEGFADEVAEAVAESEMTSLAYIARARHDDWKAAAWLLERRWPDRYGRRTKVDSTVTVTAQPFIDTAKLTLEEQEQLLALLEKARPDADQLQAGQVAAAELLPGVPEVIEG